MALTPEQTYFGMVNKIFHLYVKLSRKGFDHSMFHPEHPSQPRSFCTLNGKRSLFISSTPTENSTTQAQPISRSRNSRAFPHCLHKFIFYYPQLFAIVPWDYLFQDNPFPISFYPHTTNTRGRVVKGRGWHCWFFGAWGRNTRFYNNAK